MHWKLVDQSRRIVESFGLKRKRRPKKTAVKNSVCSGIRALSIETLEGRRLLTAEGETYSISRTVDTSALVGTVSANVLWGDGTQSAGQITGAPSEGPLRIRLDYSLDSTGFFSSQTRRDVLQVAADSLIKKFSDTLNAITPSGTNQWTAVFTHPASGSEQRFTNPPIALNELVVYAGARDLPGTELGQGSPGGFSASGTQAFLDSVRGRGQAGALGANPTDFSPWGGVITFDTGTPWHFGATTAGLDNTKQDFLSVATHELAHVLGFGTAKSWFRFATGGVYTGPASVSQYDAGGNIPTDASGAHWREGITDGGIETLMDPSITPGLRKPITRLDLAGLQDIGWTIIEPRATLNATHVFGDNGTYMMQVVLQGSRGGVTTLNMNDTITNSPPVLQPIGNKTATIGVPLSLVDLGVISDLGFGNASASPSTSERFTYSVQWGDGTANSTGSATIDRVGSPSTTTLASFDAVHTFAQSGNFLVRVVVSDDDSGQTERTFNVSVSTPPSLTLLLNQSNIAENAGNSAVSLTVRRAGSTATPLVVTLSSNDTTEASLPSQVTLAAGITEVIVPVQILDDTLLDGTVQVTLRGEATGFSATTVNLGVEDFEFVSGQFSLSSLPENSGSGQLFLTLTRSNTDTSSSVTVNLANSDSTEISLASSATIAAGTSSVTIPVTIVDDTILDGNQTISVGISGAGYRSTSSSLTVSDFEPISLSVANTRVTELASQRTTTGEVRIPFPAPAGGLVVQLTTNVTNEISIPSSVTIPAGTQTVSFPVSAVNDFLVESIENITIRGTTPGMVTGQVVIEVESDDIPFLRNTTEPLDVNDDDFIEPLDALLIINDLNNVGSRELDPAIESRRFFKDVNGDGLLSPIDVLLVINYLNNLPV